MCRLFHLQLLSKVKVMTRIAKIALIGGEVDIVKVALEQYYKKETTLGEYKEKVVIILNKIDRAVDKTARDQAKERQANLELV